MLPTEHQADLKRAAGERSYAVSSRLAGRSTLDPQHLVPETSDTDIDQPLKGSTPDEQPRGRGGQPFGIVSQQDTANQILARCNRAPGVRPLVP
jgi:hypothetical protein